MLIKFMTTKSIYLYYTLSRSHVKSSMEEHVAS